MYPAITRLPRALCILSCALLAGTVSYVDAAEKNVAQPTKAAEMVAEAPQEGTDMVIVDVDGEKLTESMMQERIQQQLASLSSRGQIPPAQLQAFMPQIRKQVEDQFVVGTLLSQEAARQKIVVDDAKVDETMAGLSKQLPPGMSFEEALKQQNMTKEELRKRIQDDLSIRKLLDAVISQDLDVTDEEIASHFDKNKASMASDETVHARHILIKVDDGADAAARDQAKKTCEAIQKKLVDGADFAKLASETSDCPSGKKGGDLGTFKRGQMVPPFDKAAFEQKPNVIGPVVETRFGYHVIEVLEHNEGNVPELAEVKDQIAAQLKQQKQSDQFDNYVDGLKKNATITHP